MLDTIPHYFYSVIDPPNKEDILYVLENAELTKQQECSWSKGCSIQFERLDLEEDFHSLFTPSLSQFFQEIQIDARNLKIQLHEVWRNTYQRNYFQEVHDHLPLHLSGVVFLTDEQEDDGQFFFYHKHYSEVSKEWRDVGLFGDRKIVKAERGKVLLFPSHMLHGVSIHRSDNIRRTVAFNLRFMTD
ncbi:MAG: hypothetical protein CMO44_05850 [Verrucomicrobiales bacterium]|nr:hypothetical protein [Verrucomicrobiales bacterium]|tara:strand:+ start:664 stop:1224 length:561 start_codon:yes stop_codon:yes gene_type:complete